MNRIAATAIAATVAIAGTIAFAPAQEAHAAQCSNSGAGFKSFKRSFADYARQNGVGRRGLAALASTSYSAGVIKYDRSINRALKRANGKSNFNKFYKKKTRGLRPITLRRMKQNSRTLRAVERRYGVPKEILVTIWGMETGFGRFTGKHDVITSLASLTHDCRRSEFFRPNLLAALKIVDKGWMSRKSMRGARHGEIGQTQFMAENYVRYGVDFDGNGRVDLVKSKADVLASTANYLRQKGWRPGGSFRPGSHNFEVLAEWNSSDAYRRAIAKFAATL